MHTSNVGGLCPPRRARRLTTRISATVLGGRKLKVQSTVLACVLTGSRLSTLLTLSLSAVANSSIDYIKMYKSKKGQHLIYAVHQAADPAISPYLSGYRGTRGPCILQQVCQQSPNTQGRLLRRTDDPSGPLWRNPSIQYGSTRLWQESTRNERRAVDAVTRVRGRTSRLTQTSLRALNSS